MNMTQICQKIELYGSLTTKDLKKPHSSRQVGGEESQRCGVAGRGDGGRDDPTFTYGG